MQIEYMTYHMWKKEIVSPPLLTFGDSDQKKLNRTFASLPSSRIESTIVPLTPDLLDAFLPVYEKQILSKDHPALFDVAAKTLGPEAKRPYFILMLKDNGECVGGILFSFLPDALSVAYRAFLPEWPYAKLQATPSLYAEFLLTQYALASEMKCINHGRDRNPYGMHAGIGLAIWKLSIGCVPYTSKAAVRATFDTDILHEDVLLLEYPGETNRITNAFLITTKETEHKWVQATKYGTQLRVTTLYR